MQRAPQFVTGDFVPHHKFLQDEEYGRALDALVKAVSDILVTSADNSQVYLGCRTVEPQPHWWFIGGRAKPGETTQQAAARNVQRELGLQLPTSRFEVIANYSLVWQMRTQAPAENGTADISTLHRLVLSPKEAEGVKLDEKEYRDARWWSCDEVLTGDFHPALKQAVRDLRAREAYLSLEEAVLSSASDAEVSALARQLIQAGGSAPQEPVCVRFDAQSETYAMYDLRTKMPINNEESEALEPARTI